jgi:hypothetical protein
VHSGNGTNRPPPPRSGRRRRPLVALVAVGVLAAGCGDNGSGVCDGAVGSAPASGGAYGVATVSATSTSLGMILVDGSGRTPYLFAKDRVTGSLLGTIKRGDGATATTATTGSGSYGGY